MNGDDDDEPSTQTNYKEGYSYMDRPYMRVFNTKGSQ